MCHPLRSARHGTTIGRSRGWCLRRPTDTSGSTIFTMPSLERPGPARPHPGRRQAGCMAKTEKRPKPQRVPEEVLRAVAAAEDKKAADIVLLDLRKASGF